MPVFSRMARPSIALGLMCLCLASAGCGRLQFSLGTPTESLPDIAKADSDVSRHGRKVRTKALVTYSDPEWHLLFIADGQFGMYIDPPPGIQLRTGDLIQIEGKTAPFAKGLQDPNIFILARDTPLPEPLNVSTPTALKDLISQWIRITGTVRWAGPRDDRMVIRVRSANQDVSVFFFQANAGELPPIGSEVTLSGVAAAETDSAGRINGARILCPSAHYVNVLSLGPGDPFSLPLSRPQDLPAAKIGSLAHVRGLVRIGSAGTSVEIEGRQLPITLSEPLPPNAYEAEVTGFWTGKSLEDCVLRPIAERVARKARVVRLSQLKHLSATEAAAHLSTSVRVVVTYADLPWGILFVQDESAAAFVDAHELKVQLQPGDVVDIMGISSPGDFAPSISEPKIAFVRRGRLPQPVKIQVPAANLGRLDSQWCTVDGVVHSARNQDGRTTLKLGVGGADINLQFPTTIANNQLVNKHVSATGALGIVLNERKQAIGYQMFVPAEQFLRLHRAPPPRDAIRSIDSLQRYEPGGDQLHSVALQGIVAVKSRPDTVFIQDTTGAIEVRGVKALPVTDGDVISVRGFVVPGEYSPILEDAEIVGISPGLAPSAKPISAELAFSRAYDSEFVEMRGTVKDVRNSATGTVVTLASNGILFDATGPDIAGNVSSLRPGSMIAVRGICQVFLDRSRIPFSVQRISLIFDSPRSITILQPAPWWNPRRVAWALLIVIGVAASVIAWATVLRRKVASKTRELQRSLDLQRNLQLFEADRTSILEAVAASESLEVSLDRMAVAVEKQIGNAVCIIILLPESCSEIPYHGNRRPIAVAPNLPESLKYALLSIATDHAGQRPFAQGLSCDLLSKEMVKVVNGSGTIFGCGHIVPVLHLPQESAGAVLVFLKESRSAELTPPEAVIIESAAGLVAIAYEHWDMQQRLVHEAQHDPLTGLPNRSLTDERLERAQARADRSKHSFAVLCLDLDGFKQVNDRLGHLAGDELLRAIALRLQAHTRKADTVGRMGGDEFIVILEECSEPIDALVAGENLIATLKQPVQIEQAEFTVTASIGAAMYPRDGQNPATLTRHADEAMYRAKAAGGNRICFWSELKGTTDVSVPPAR